MLTSKLLELARTLSQTYHTDQKYGQEDYFAYHITGVVNSLKLHNYSENFLIVAYLHDIVEDTEVSLDTIKNLFGVNIANAVDAITKRDGEARPDYLARCSKNNIARMVKLHDAMFNANNCAKNKNKQKYNEYISETIAKLLM